MKKIKLPIGAAFGLEQVEELTREAFGNRHAPGCQEHYLLYAPTHSLKSWISQQSLEGK